jgi:hypothetical protein
VAAVLDALRAARAELADAGRIVDVIAAGLDEDLADDPVAGARSVIELQVAEFRRALWSQTVDRIEQRAQSLGLQP